ncbi:uncharacterized protein [Nicotiana tomentosiformis]|uniref:uncharacterized protein n=1 Tax=Nicotiana tomentosiformis TaxID=4098 RepID=UPI00388C54FA
MREFIPHTLRDAWHAKFEKLHQGTMTVSEYAILLNGFSRHAPALVSIVKERVRRFSEGLNYGIRFSIARELKTYTPYQQVVDIARRLECMRGHKREDRGGQGPLGTRGFSGGHATDTAHHGRGSMSRLVHSALPASSGAPLISRSRVAHFAQPLSSAPLARDAFSGQYCRPGPSQSQQPHPPRACFECGNIRHMFRDCPRLWRGVPP